MRKLSAVRWMFFCAMAVTAAQGALAVDEAALKENFRSALRAYDEGNFAEAERAFSQLASAAPRSVAALHNLGLSLSKRDRPSEAIAAYLAARALSPRNEDVALGLKVALEQAEVQGKVSLQKPWYSLVLWRVRAWFSERELWNGTAALLLASGLLMFLVRRKMGLVLGLGSLALGLVGIATLGLIHVEPIIWAAVKGDGSKGETEETQAFSSPSKHGTLLFSLRPGTPVAMTKKFGEWFQIETTDRRKAWLQASTLAFFPQAFGTAEKRLEKEL